MFNIVRPRSARPMVLCFLLSASLAHGLAAPAHAQSSERRSTIVETYDLDLQSIDGRRERDRRINYAARAVCAPSSGMRAYFSYFSRECMREAVRTARPLSTTDCLLGAGEGSRTCEVTQAQSGMRRP